MSIRRATHRWFRPDADIPQGRLRWQRLPAQALAATLNPVCVIGSRVDTESLLSLKEAADQFELSYSHLRWLARSGRLTAQKLGRDWFTTTEAVATYVANTELRSKDPHKNKRR